MATAAYQVWCRSGCAGRACPSGSAPVWIRMPPPARFSVTGGGNSLRRGAPHSLSGTAAGTRRGTPFRSLEHARPPAGRWTSSNRPAAPPSHFRDNFRRSGSCEVPWRRGRSSFAGGRGPRAGSAGWPVGVAAPLHFAPPAPPAPLARPPRRLGGQVPSGRVQPRPGPPGTVGDLADRHGRVRARRHRRVRRGVRVTPRRPFRTAPHATATIGLTARATRLTTAQAPLPLG